MPPAIPEHIRDAILTDIRARHKSRAQIARDHNVSPSTVGKIATAAGISDPFTRTHTENATRARQADNKARRAAIASSLLDDITALRERAWTEHEQYERGVDGPVLVKLRRPPPRDVQALYTSIGISLQRHLDLERHDRDSDTADTASMLGDLFDQLRAARDAGQTG